MPNWVKNNLRIKSNGEKVLEVLEMLKDEHGQVTFEKIVPTPEELLTEASPQRDNKKAKKFIEKYGADDWYNWRCKNWGCKWDAGESDFYEQDGYSMVTFETPWSPPEEFIRSLSKMFPNVTFEMQYAEEGVGFVGQMVAENGKIRSYEPKDGEDTVAINNSIWAEGWETNWKGEEYEG